MDGGENNMMDSSLFSWGLAEEKGVQLGMCCLLPPSPSLLPLGRGTGQLLGQQGQWLQLPAGSQGRRVPSSMGDTLWDRVRRLISLFSINWEKNVTLLSRPCKYVHVAFPLLHLFFLIIIFCPASWKPKLLIFILPGLNASVQL